MTISVDSYVRGGGAGGGNPFSFLGAGGGGGAGDEVTGTVSLGPGTYPVVIGAGGAPNSDGGTSTFAAASLSAPGGGAGTEDTGHDGPCGGGGTYDGSDAPYAGGVGSDGYNGADANYVDAGIGGGGGGRGGAGEQGDGGTPPIGGVGTTDPYGAVGKGCGGGGGATAYGDGNVGTGGGGDTGYGAGDGADTGGITCATAGLTNTGSGGGGGSANPGLRQPCLSAKAGGSGITVHRYLTASAAGFTIIGGTKSTSGSYTYHVFNSSSNLVIASSSAIKTVDDLAQASIKTVDGLAIASMKARLGL